MSILLLEPIHPAAIELLAAHDEVVQAASPAEPEAGGSAQQVVAVLTRGRGRVTADLIERLPNLQVVARCGVGLDNIDLAAAKARGLSVIYAPGSTTASLAEHTMMLMLAAARRLSQVAAAVHAGRWDVRNQYMGLELRGKTLGIIGLGDIGRRVAELAEAFQMRVVYWSRSSREPRYEAMELPDLLASADVVSLHTALTAETRQLIGAAELARMKPDAILINTARGALIDQAALRVALERGQIGLFAADVLDPEPPELGEALLTSERTLITPHIAAITDVTYEAMCVSTARNVLAILRGEPPQAQSIYRQ
jgi:D-3-phosphoglycerate dehydrogenase / 2-oxoglutarate reductase